MSSLFQSNFLNRAGAVITAGGLLFTAVLLSGCNKGSDEAAPSSAPPAAGAGSGAPTQTAEQKQAEEAAHSQSASVRAAHVPPAAK